MVQVCVQLTMGTMEGVSAIASLTIQPGTALESGELANLAMYYNAYVLFHPSLSVCVCLSLPPSLPSLSMFYFSPHSLYVCVCVSLSPHPPLFLHVLCVSLSPLTPLSLSMFCVCVSLSLSLSMFYFSPHSLYVCVSLTPPPPLSYS